MKKSKMQDFLENPNSFLKDIKDNPKEIIKWCLREIKAYKILIELLKKRGVK